jgi:threonine/homoserine/homoserine lactone efflux protein
MELGAPLWLFFIMVLGIVVVPGMDMAFVAGSALHGGRRAGLLAVAGIMVGGAFHVTIAALGLAALVQWVPGLFNLLLVAGAAYLVWIGLSLWRTAPRISTSAKPVAGGATFQRALVTSVLNPKAYVFSLAVFPQFMQPGERSLALHFLFMGLIVVAVQAGVYGSVALAASHTGTALGARPRLQQFIARATASVLVLGAVLTAFEGWRGA